MGARDAGASSWELSSRPACSMPRSPGNIAVFLTLWSTACVPLTMLPPPAPLPSGRPVELGASLTVNPPLGEVCRLERSDDGVWDTVCRAVTTGNADISPAGWLLIKLSERFDIGGVLGATSLGGGFGGLFARGWILSGESVRLGLYTEGGAIWWGAGVPVALRLTPEVWLYTQPEVVYIDDLLTWNPGTFEWRAPLGVSADVSPVVRLTGELMATWLPTSGHERFNHMAFRGTIGVAVHPGRKSGAGR